MKRALTFLLTLVFAFTACEKAPFITMTGPRVFSFTRDGGTQSFTFSCNQDWSVSSTESWVIISPASGKASDGDITVTLTCSPNTTYDARSATVTIKLAEISESLTLTQDTDIGLILSPTTFDLTNAAQDIEIEVRKNIQYSIAFDEACIDWIKIGGTKSLSTDKVTFHISENKTYDCRDGKITFKQIDGPLSETVIVRQSQLNGLFITTPTYDISNTAHMLSVEVKANVEFQVTSQSDWIKFVETKGLTTSNVTLSIEANELYDNRTGTVQVKQTNGDLSGIIMINQKQTDGLFVTPTEFSVNNQEQSIELEVKNNIDFMVVIPDDAKSWVAVQSSNQTKALVEEKVILLIAKNSTYDDRETSITIKQVDGPLAETVNIKQAYGEGLIIEQTAYNVPQEGGTIEVKVQSNVEFEVIPVVEWIKYVETKGLSSTSIELVVESNISQSYRDGVVIIRKAGYDDLSTSISITQLPLPCIETLYPTDVETHAATLNGKLSVALGDEKALVWFIYSDDADTIDDLIKNGTIVSATLDNDMSFSTRVDVLRPYTDYYYVACVEVFNKIYYGEGMFFSTKRAPIESVDLGLTVKWAKTNIGSLSPEGFGDYYAWGEVEAKQEYTWDNYKWYTDYNDHDCTFTIIKYCINSNTDDGIIGIVDNKTVLEPEDDVAHCLLGEKWRIPTKQDWEELLLGCDWTWDNINGFTGYTFTSKTNGNSIFLPAAFYVERDEYPFIGAQKYGLYLSSSLYESHDEASDSCWCLSFWSDRAPCLGGGNRHTGTSIRPVTE